MICMDCRYIRERPSGIGLVVRELVDRLPLWMPDEKFLLLKHPKAPQRLSSSANTREIVVASEANGPATMWWLPRIVPLGGVELFHAPYNILPAGLRMATIVTMHDVMWLSHPLWAQSPGVWGWVERGFYQHGIRRALRAASRIVAITEATRSEIVHIAPDVQSRVRVLLQGVSAVFRPSVLREEAHRDGRMRSALLPGVARYVLTVGQYTAYKNHDLVVRAFAKAFGAEGDVHLALVQRLGRGARRLRPIARRLGVAERVHVLPTVSEAELVALYRGAACLCHPSLIEGFGLPLAEAMACGCPVVTSFRSAMPEVCADAAAFVDPLSEGAVVDALRRVVRDAQYAGILRARGLARAAQLSWDRYARGHEALYREVLAEGRRGGRRPGH